MLTAEKAGFKKYQQANLQLLVNVPTSVNVVLQVGASTTQIEVSAQAPVINTEDATMGIAFGENQVKELPLEGRNVPDLLTLQPGVAYTGNRADTSANDTRSGAVNGARSDQGNVSLDGIRVNDEGGQAFTSVLPVTLDSVQEFRVTTSNANADEGGTSGAQVALVTKSGTNSIHGSVYEYLRNTYTSANDYFNKLAQLTNCTLPNPNDCNTPPKLIRNIFGASIGGPIKKDRLFLFMNYEGTRRAEETVSSGEEVPSLAMRDGVLQYLCTPITAQLSRRRQLRCAGPERSDVHSCAGIHRPRFSAIATDRSNPGGARRGRDGVLPKPACAEQQCHGRWL